MITRQFGRPLPGIEYTDRPGAYAVIMDDDERFIAVIHRGEYFLPGGGQRGEEGPEAALKREVAEETGYAIEIGDKIGEANEYTRSLDDGRYYNKLGTFFTARITGRAGLSGPPEHGVIRVSLDEFSPRTELTSHVWAVWQTLRLRQGKLPREEGEG